MKFKQIISNYRFHQEAHIKKWAGLGNFLSPLAIKGYMDLYRTAIEKLGPGNRKPLVGEKHTKEIRQKISRAYRK